MTFSLFPPVNQINQTPDRGPGRILGAKKIYACQQSYASGANRHQALRGGVGLKPSAAANPRQAHKCTHTHMHTPARVTISMPCG